MARRKLGTHRRSTPHHGEAGAYIPATVPKVAVLVAIVVLIAIGAATVIFDHKGDKGTRQVLENIALVLPLLVTGFFAERASRDIRNGTVVAKAKEGATAALEEHGPKIVSDATKTAIQEEQVLTRVGPVVTTEVLALAKLLTSSEENTKANQDVLALLQDRLPTGGTTSGTPARGSVTPGPSS